MCCTIGANGKAELTDTRLYVGEATMEDKYVHVLAYQNNAKTDGPNAMILPFPTNVPMGPLNTVKTSGMKEFLNDIVEATKIPTKGMRGMAFGAAVAGMSDSFAQVFDVGSYTVILADKISQVPEALKRVDARKRPEVNLSFLLGYGRLYPNQPVALCCWDGMISDIEPLLWWYEPKNPDMLFIPTMDAHDGGPPDLNAIVKTDHIITVGSRIKPGGQDVLYSDDLTVRAAPLLPLKAHGHQVDSRIQNGDSFVSIASLRGNSNVMIKRGANVDTIHSENRMRGW